MKHSDRLSRLSVALIHSMIMRCGINKQFYSLISIISREGCQANDFSIAACQMEYYKGRGIYDWFQRSVPPDCHAIVVKITQLSLSNLWLVAYEVDEKFIKNRIAHGVLRNYLDENRRNRFKNDKTVFSKRKPSSGMNSTIIRHCYWAFSVLSADYSPAPHSLYTLLKAWFALNGNPFAQKKIFFSSQDYPNCFGRILGFSTFFKTTVIEICLGHRTMFWSSLTVIL